MQPDKSHMPHAAPPPGSPPLPWRKLLLSPLILLVMGVAAALPGEQDA